MSVTDRLQVLSVSMREAGKYEIMHNSKGQPYKVVYRDFIRWVTKEFGGGAKAGPYLRDEEPIPDHLLGRLRDEIGATGKGIPRKPRGPGRKRGPDIGKLWERLREAVWKMGEREGDVSDFVNDGSGRSVREIAESMSADVGQALEYSVDGYPRIKRLWDQFFEALSTGVYTPGAWEDWDAQERLTRLRENYSGGWFEGALKSA